MTNIKPGDVVRFSTDDDPDAVGTVQRIWTKVSRGGQMVTIKDERGRTFVRYADRVRSN